MAEQSPGAVPKHVEDIKTAPARRREKTPSERIERVEERLDAHDVVLAKIDGQMDGQDTVLGLIKASVDRLEQRDHVLVTAKIDIAKTKAIADVQAEQTARDDAADAAQNRRKRWTQIIGFVTAGGGLIELLHQLGVLR